MEEEVQIYLLSCSQHSAKRLLFYTNDRLIILHVCTHKKHLAFFRNSYVTDVTDIGTVILKIIITINSGETPAINII